MSLITQKYRNTASFTIGRKRLQPTAEFFRPAVWGIRGGAALGALQGATSQDVWRNPETGEAYQKHVGLLGRTGRVLGGALTGGALGGIAGGAIGGVNSLIRNREAIANGIRQGVQTVNEVA